MEEAGWDLRRAPRCPDVLSREDSRAPQGLARPSSSWSPVMPGVGTGGCVSPRVEVGTLLTQETLHRRPGANCAPLERPMVS